MRNPQDDTTHRLRRVLGLGLTAAIVVVGLHGAAAGGERLASATTTGEAQAAPGGWSRFHAGSFTRARGELCPFAMRSRVLFDREYVRTTRAFADDSPRRQEYVGPLVVRVKNLESGRAVTRDLSARGIVDYRRDGSFDFELLGPAAVGFYPGDSLRPGYYVLKGIHVVRFQADGTRQVILDRGPEENLCRTLG